MLVVQQASPGWGYVMDELAKNLPSNQFIVRKYDPSKPLANMASDADVLILATALINKDILDAAPKLRMIHQHGRGVDNVDIPYATKKGVYVCNIPGENATSVAEQAMLLILALAKKYKSCQKSFEEQKLGIPPTQEVKGKTIGIIGLGATGKELARIARGFRMKILATTEHPETKTMEERALVDFLGGTGQTDFILQNSDYVSLHVPLNEKTRKMVNHSWFGKMKPTASLINIARGGIVDKEDLYQALVNKRIAGAALDVFWQYPPNPEEPLFQLENVIVTPHMAGFTTEMYQRYAEIISQNILRLTRGENPNNIVNQEVLVQKSNTTKPGHIRSNLSP